MMVRLFPITAALCALCVTPARAEEIAPAIDLSVAYTADSFAMVSGGNDHRLRYLDNLDIVADVDLDRLVGWNGARAHFYALNNLGLRPNDAAGSLQGIDNIEVPKRRLKLYEAWIEQSFGDRVSLLVGLFDLNSEFYVNDAAGLLISSAFGMGTELAATGSNGPSIFPSTSLAARLSVRIGEAGYVRAAVFNAHAASINDPGGVDTGFDEGVLLIGEAGVDGAIGGKGKFALGAWRYSKRQDDTRETDITGAPLRHVARGAYLLAEYPVAGFGGDRELTAFARIGISDGKTGDFDGGWQAGFLMSGLFAQRPDSQLSFGITNASLAGRFRRNLVDAGITPTGSETILELTYSDRLAPFLVVQPDLQWITDTGGNRATRNAVAAGLRVTVEF